MQYLVEGTGGPSFSSSAEMIGVLENVVLPCLDALAKLEAQGVILAGGLPVAQRAFAFIVEATSNDELDRLLRGLAMWPAMQWRVTPLQSFGNRAAIEKDFLSKAGRP